MLFSIDLDGTLLRSDYSVSSFTKETIRKAVALGHTVLLSSGRPPRSIFPYRRLLGLKGPMIAFNGALAYDPDDGDFPCRRELFSYRWLIGLEGQMEGRLSSLMCESMSAIYAYGFDKELDRFFPYEGMKASYGPLKETLKEDCYTALFRLKDEKDEALLKAKVEEAGNMLYRPWRNSPYSEAYRPGVDKGSALKHVREALGIHKEETVAFGDSNNDVPMFMEAGKAYLVANGRVTIPGAACEKASLGNDDDAVAHLIASML